MFYLVSGEQRLFFKKNPVLDFLQNHEKGDFLIIDDESFDYKQHFSNDKIIKTAIFKESLSKKHIDTWLDKHPELMSEQSEKEF